MMTSNNETKDLLIKYLKGECNPTEQALIESWYLQFNEHEIALSVKRIEDIKHEISKELPDPKIRKINWLYKISAAVAAVMILVGIATLFLTKGDKLPQGYANDINPGTNRATLTLTDGTTIVLSNAKTGVVVTANELTYNDGSQIKNLNANNKDLQTAATPCGGQYQITLPDGTKVWLNAASTLKFPQTFSGLVNRKVELSGEAYFEVTKDNGHPFVVESNKQTVKVLGTQFNINSYSDEPNIKTTLIEGSVNVNNNTTLKPDQQSINSGGTIIVKEVDTDSAIAWKNGEFAFSNEPLKSIMKKIARWYDVEVIYQNDEIGKKSFGGSISRFKKVSQILCMLELTGKVKFKIEGRRITVME
ncbi:FecR family protein [Pedobacter sp. B4-66]|uniref:FecR family protein n=1 Tax=Pedobacter sp. B4-66 TaxID=2817280 RepID=UPI001BD95351|nr:FecR family protein [Pedobacter sp. B4-66]